MKCGGGYIVPGTCGFSITVAKIQKAGASNSFGVNCRYCLTSVFHAQVLESEAMQERQARLPLHQFWGRTDGPVGTAFVGASGKLTDNIVRFGVNYKFF
jgi:hypothetical protein